jgi:amidase
MMGELLETHRDQIADDIVDNVERGFAVTPQDLFEAERVRWQLAHRIAAFFETHDFLLCPSASISPFPVEQQYVTEIDGQPCETYIDWFAVTFALTMTSCPVISIPCGFTSDGLPVGMQIMGRPRGEAALLQSAHQFEQLLAVTGELPIDPR